MKKIFSTFRLYHSLVTFECLLYFRISEGVCDSYVIRLVEKEKTENNGKKVITGLKEQLVKEYIFIHIKLKHCEYYINIVSTRCIP